MKTITLSNDLQVEALDAFEARVLYREIFEMGVYTAHGISIREGDCVVDIGANIGLFSLMALQAGQRIKLFAAEPIPALHKALHRNLQRYAGQSQVTVLPFGLAAQEGAAEFVFTPHSSMTSTMYPAKTTSNATMIDWLAAGLSDVREVAPAQRSLIDHLQRGLTVPGLRYATALALAVAFAPFAVRNALLTRRVCCPLRSLSQVIDEYQIETIDLLKIDVEGSEADVVRGIAETDWPRIRQMVIEVHDVNGRVAGLRALLDSRGFQTHVQQEDWALHHLMQIHSLYGTRVNT